MNCIGGYEPAAPRLGTERGPYCSRCAKACQVARRGTSANQHAFTSATVAKTDGACAVCGTRDGVQAHHPALCRRCHRHAHR